MPWTRPTARAPSSSISPPATGRARSSPPLASTRPGSRRPTRGRPCGGLVARPPGVAAGPGGLFSLPYLTGERSPHPDPLARGAFVGLTVQHDRRHLTRAVLEGVAFGLRDGLDLMLAAGAARPALAP